MQNPDKIFGRLSNRMFQMAALYAYTKDNNFPFFVQDEKYFAKYKDEIKALYSDGIVPNSIDRVAIHVRRAKNPINPQEPAYSENQFYVDLGHHLHEDMSDNYYVRAMAEFPNEKFLVFSDDIWWCKKQEMFKDCEFADECPQCDRVVEFGELAVICPDGIHETDEITDMNRMASCKGIIGANSSFSWWGAYLSGAEKIVFPKQWFASEENEHLIGIPSEWRRI